MTMSETTPQAFPQSAPPPAVEQLVSMTDAAVAKVEELRGREGKTDARLRLFVKAGGCSGFSYGLAFDDRLADDDKIEDHAGVPVVIDAFSAQYVDGAEIDCVDSLMGSGFAINNPNAVSSCGCGVIGRWTLRITGPDQRVEERSFHRPYALVGSRADNCLRLNHLRVSRRHAYFQALPGGIVSTNADVPEIRLHVLIGSAQLEHDHRIVALDRGLHEPKGLMGRRREHDPHATRVQEEGSRNL